MGPTHPIWEKNLDMAAGSNGVPAAGAPPPIAPIPPMPMGPMPPIPMPPIGCGAYEGPLLWFPP